MEDRKHYSESSHSKKHSSHRLFDQHYDKKGYDRESHRDSKYDKKDDRRDDHRSSSSNFFKADADYQYGGFSKSFVPDSKDQLVTVEKNFYTESDNVKKRNPDDVKAFRDSVKITIKSDYAPNPITTFEESSFPTYILDVLKTKGFQRPTAIQSQGWPIVLKGHDLIGIAQTGSGKTIGFLLPGIVHMKAQEPLRNGDGPIGLVLAPTRELAIQIYDEFKPFANTSRLKATCIYGGADKYPQRKDLRNGCELVIATPGRLIDFLESGDTNLKRVSYLVIDEADRMLDMGFVPQIEKIVQYIRKDRQTLMWSATWPREIRKLAEDLCKEKPIHIVVGNDDLAVNKAVTQLVKVVPPKEKFDKFLRLIRGIYDGSKILVFCQTKKTSDWVSRTLQSEGYKSVSIHGDKSQNDRDRIMGLFKDQRVPILVATNLAARGLDVKDIRFVINYDFPTQMEEYVHRVGRTGRGGATGTSFTLFTEEDARFSKDLIKILADNHQKVPDELYDLVHDRRFKEKMQRYDKSNVNRDAKEFSDYEKAGPSHRDHDSNRSSHHHHHNNTRFDSHNRGGFNHTHHASRPPYPQNFHTSNPTQPPTTSLSTNMSSTFNPMYSNNTQMQQQQQVNPQQYAMMMQMHMMQMMQQQQQHPSGQTNSFGTMPGQFTNGMTQPSTMTEPKKDSDGKNAESVQDTSGTANPKNGFNQYNSNGYYRELYNTNGNGYYNQQAVPPQGDIPKKPEGTSRFSDAKPSEPYLPQENKIETNQPVNGAVSGGHLNYQSKTDNDY